MQPLAPYFRPQRARVLTEVQRRMILGYLLEWDLNTEPTSRV